MSTKSRAARPRGTKKGAPGPHERGIATSIHNSALERLRQAEERLRGAHELLVRLVHDRGGEVTLRSGGIPDGAWALEAEALADGGVVLRLKAAG